PGETTCSEAPSRSGGKRRTGSRSGSRCWRTSSGRQTGAREQRWQRRSLSATGGRSREFRRRRASARAAVRGGRGRGSGGEREAGVGEGGGEGVLEEEGVGDDLQTVGGPGVGGRVVVAAGLAALVLVRDERAVTAA